MNKISVIIPVYNVEDYLSRCLDSVIAQTFGDIEIICINDGSTDNSLNILEQYALLDSRITVINMPEHKGQSAARNIGIEKCGGKYILFVDSDDCISSVAAEELYKFAERETADVVIFDYAQGDLNYSEYDLMHCQNENLLTPDCFNHKSIDDDLYKYIPVTVWSKLYRTDLIKNNKIYFTEGICYEDVPFWADVFTSADNIKILQMPLYYYNIKSKSSVMTKKGKVVFDVFKAYKNVIKIFKTKKCYKKYQHTINLLMVMDMLKKFEKITPELREKYYTKLKNLKCNIDYDYYENDKYVHFEKNYIRKFKTLSTANYEVFCRIMGVE